MAWSLSDIPDQTGRVAVVTGANSGLGLESARALAGAGAHVVMCARNPEKGQAALESVKETHPEASVELTLLDLASLSSIERAAAEIAGKHPQVHILMNNAGLMAIPESKTEDGFEMQFGVNHLGHWALTARLLPTLLRTEGARVVTVTSTAHHLGRAVDVENPHLEGRYNPWRAYNNSKLANFHFGIGLQRAFDSAGVGTKSLIAHPGLTNSELQARSVRETGGASQRFFHLLASRWGMSSERGAHAQLRAATDPKARGGQFYAPRFIASGNAVPVPIMRRIGLDNAIRKLWEVSERETGLKLEVSPTP